MGYGEREEEDLILVCASARKGQSGVPKARGGAWCLPPVHASLAARRSTLAMNVSGMLGVLSSLTVNHQDSSESGSEWGPVRAPRRTPLTRCLGQTR